MRRAERALELEIMRLSARLEELRRWLSEEIDFDLERKPEPGSAP